MASGSGDTGELTAAPTGIGAASSSDDVLAVKLSADVHVGSFRKRSELPITRALLAVIAAAASAGLSQPAAASPTPITL